MMAKEIKTRFEISADELAARMLKQQELHIEPGQKAVQILEAALDTVLKKLGVNVDDVETIPDQMNALGIIMTENTDERAPQINGFFVFLAKDCDIIPYSWVGAARLESDGRCYCDIQFFQDERLQEVGGIRLIK
jgi:hypothetical protein